MPATVYYFSAMYCEQHTQNFRGLARTSDSTRAAPFA